MKKTKTNLLAAAAMLVIWLVLVFAIQLESGWVHVAMGAAAVFVARAIIVSGGAAEAD